MKNFLIDIEFWSQTGANPKPWCVAWHCLDTGEEGTLWLDGTSMPSPFPKEFRMIGHYVLAELGCFMELGWPLPTEVIDTLAEARTVRGQVAPAGGSWGLLAVANQLGISTMSSDHKNEMRELAMGEQIPVDRRRQLMDYCLEDVHTGLAIWRVLEPSVNLPEAVFRGRYLKALAYVERRGIPADVDLVESLRSKSPDILDALWINARGAYGGVIQENGEFSSKAWLQWCAGNGVPWPLLSSGAPALDADTFKKMSDRFPEIRIMAYARKLRGQSRRFDFALGEDGRLRCMLSPFGSDTGRNQPSNSKYIFGASAWARSVVAAPTGTVLAYIDYCSEEVGVAAAVAGDKVLLADYLTSDPYMAFAIRAGAARGGATKKSHPQVRAIYKLATLSLQYGIGDISLAQNLGIPIPAARRLIRDHQDAYPAFWRWRSAIVDEVMCGGTLSTRYGWQRKAKPKDSANSIANFPVQAAGGEVLRVATIALEEAGHRVVAPVHDALLVEMDEVGWQEELAEIRRLMSRAAEVVTGGLSIPTDVELVFPGENYLDGRGTEFWKIAAPVLGRGPYRRPEVGRSQLSESQI